MSDRYVDHPAATPTPRRLRGRGSAANPGSCFDAHIREAVDDGWWQEEDATDPGTELGVDTSRSIISYNESPDIPFDRSLNPYRGCEHGCIY
ncbi:MAG: hypothetical protein PVG09_01825, partial [Thiohalocapsa sp.]